MTEEAERPEGIEDIGASPTRIANPAIRQEMTRAAVWIGMVGLAVLAVWIAQSLLVVFGAMVFAAMIDGGARLLGRTLKIGRGWRIAIVLLGAAAFFIWLTMFAGNQISREAAQLPMLIEAQVQRALAAASAEGFAMEVSDLQGLVGQAVSGVGTVTRALGGILGAVTTLVLVLIMGLYVAMEPRLYERGLAWMLPQNSRAEFHVLMSDMAFTMRRLMFGRLVGMVFEGLLTYAMLAAYGVPMAALLSILTGLLAFIPNLGAFISGVLMVLVGFSGGYEMGLYTILVYFVVQTFDGYVVIPLIAKKTVDLAPALVLAFQLIMGILFGVIGLFLADPLLAMIKVALEHRAAQAAGHVRAIGKAKADA
ncbi:MAG: AI-2E family transporter [Alteraurantiacibacter sp.]